jgi:ADP-heptose:LPS heptosyltransferase
MKLWFERGAWASGYGRRTIEKMAPEDVKRVAVVRHAALGDMVLVRPFLVEARKFFPNAEIVLSLVTNYTYGAPIDLADSVHVVHGNDLKKVPVRERIAKAKELGEVDIFFDLADTVRSRYLCFITKAKVKIGFPYRWYQRNLLLDAAVPRSDFSFEAVTMLDTLMLLGANPEVPLNFAWPKELVDRSEPRQSTVIYFPFASVSSKCWPADRFLSLIDQAATDYPNYNHVVLAGTGVHENVNDFTVLAQKHVNVNLQESMNLEETIKLIAKVCLVVSNDTGVRNLAISLDTSTVGIFFNTVPYRYWPRDGKHQAVFNANGSIPVIEDVLFSIEHALS